MVPFGLLLTLTLVFGGVAQSCDVGGFTIDDLRDTVIVTNASTSQEAQVLLSTNLGRVDAIVPAGTTTTFGIMAATTYTLQVWAPDDPSGATYRKSLLDLRDELMDLSINPGDSSATPVSALAQVLLVQTALQQLHGSKGSQTCSGKVTTGVESRATVTWTEPTGTGFWALSCG